MKNLSIREMRNALGRLPELLEEEGEILITRRGRPIARVMPLGPPPSRPDHTDLRRLTGRVGVPSEVLLREERDVS